MSYLLSLLISLSCLSLLFYPSPTKKLRKSVYYFTPPSLIKHFHFGFSETYADILWLRWLQDVDFCHSEKGLPVYDGKTKYSCEEGWSYQMMNLITELAPRFLKAYEVSGSILSIVMNDVLGAKKIYDKALENFPDIWRLHYTASYVYLNQLNDIEKGAYHLKRAADLGGPKWLYSLASKSYKKINQLNLARQILLEAIKKDKEGVFKAHFEKKLKEIEDEIKKADL